VGASRKAFIGHITGRPAGPARAIGSLATVAAAQRAGAAFVRVHDVRETVDFLKVLAAIEESR
jgi:dihydropteroate synthase